MEIPLTDLFAEFRHLDAERHELGDRVDATLSPEQRALYLELEAAESAYRVHEQRILGAALGRHLPFLATAITVIAEHVADSGTGHHPADRVPCCADGASA